MNYDEKLTQYVEDIATRQEEARNAEERSAARQRIRATFAGAQASMRMMAKGRRPSLRGQPGSHGGENAKRCAVWFESTGTTRPSAA